MGWSFPTWFEECLIEGLLVGNESTLVIYLLLVFNQSLATHLGLLLFDLLCDQVLKP